MNLLIQELIDIQHRLNQTAGKIRHKCRHAPLAANFHAAFREIKGTLSYLEDRKAREDALRREGNIEVIRTIADELSDLGMSVQVQDIESIADAYREGGEWWEER